MKPLFRLFRQLLDHKNAIWLLIILLVLLPVFTAWIGDILKDAWTACWAEEGCSSFSTVDLSLLAIAVSLAAAALYGVHRLGREFISPRIVKQQQNDVQPHPVVIALLSPQKELTLHDGQWMLNNGPLSDNIRHLVDPGLKLSGFTWQQTLRAGHHHHKDGTLQKLLLIGSHGNGGSGSGTALELAKAFFGHYFPGIEVLAPGIQNPAIYSPDFEDLEATRAALKKAITLCGAKDRDIIIDITGGQKTASIAATLVTLDRADLMFQYVGTGDNTGKIYGFDAVTERSQG